MRDVPEIFVTVLFLLLLFVQNVTQYRRPLLPTNITANITTTVIINLYVPAALQPVHINQLTVPTGSIIVLIGWGGGERRS